MRLGGSLALPTSAGFEFFHTFGIEGAPGTGPPSNEGGTSGGCLDSTVATPPGPPWKRVTIRDQRASARTHEFFAASGAFFLLCSQQSTTGNRQSQRDSSIHDNDLAGDETPVHGKRNGNGSDIFRGSHALK